MSNKLYDQLKWVAQVLLPALALLYIALSPLWGLPKQEEVAGSIVALDLFLGTLLGISSIKYNNSDRPFDGYINVAETDQRTLFELNLDDPPENLKNKNKVSFKVRKQQE